MAQPPTRAPWALQPPETGGTKAPRALPTAPPTSQAAPRTGRAPPALIPAAPRFPTPIDPSTTPFLLATKRITSPDLLQSFLASDSAKSFVSFLLSLNESVKGRALSDPCVTSPMVEKLLSLLTELHDWVDAIPPSQQSLRYGNPAYRQWHARLVERLPELLMHLLPASCYAALPELAPYLADSFGNATRIDYGTGHEANFAAFLYCLARLGLVTPADRTALVLRVFASYWTLMRRVQTTYWLEPAGSHGVWGLDDYQFLPFFFGSAQLVDHPYLKPSCIHDEHALRDYQADYAYLAAVLFVRNVKKGPLGETSPMLNDISGVSSWTKINQGMVKMYQAELLAKFPIMQHFLFGNLLPFPSEEERAAMQATALVAGMGMGEEEGKKSAPLNPPPCFSS